MEVTKATNKRRRRSGRAKKILSPHSRRVLQDLADQDWQLIESITKRTISKLNDVGTVTPPHPILQFLVGGGEEKVAEKINEASDTARTDALPHAADSNSQDKSEQNAQKVTPGLPRVRERARRRTSRFLVLDHGVVETNDEKLDETLTTALTVALPHAADSKSQDKSEQNAQKVTRELTQRKGTRLPTIGRGASFFLRDYVKKDEDKTMESFVNEGLRKQYQESKFNLSPENSQKPSPPLRHQSAFRASLGACTASSGRFAYWRDNVRKMNCSHMWNAHPRRQQRATAKTEKKIRELTGTSFGIINTTQIPKWKPKWALVPKDPPEEEKKVEVRVITCFGCGKPGHKQADCPYVNVGLNVEHTSKEKK